MAQTEPIVVIVGAGFGGLRAARALLKAPIDVALSDRRNFHLFRPLLYQVATNGVSLGEIAHPARGILRGQSQTIRSLSTAAVNWDRFPACKITLQPGA
jgi:NADH dehydrogenase